MNRKVAGYSFLAVGLIGTLALLADDVIREGEFTIGNLVTHGGLFLSLVFYVYLIKRHEHKKRD